MSSAPRQPKFARRHGDDRILCWRRRCGFCFGEVGSDDVASIDPGFVLVRLKDDEPGEIPGVGFALGSVARRAYRQAKRDRTVTRFRAPGRHRKGPSRITHDVLVACPEHGVQVLSPAQLGAVTTVENVGRQAYRKLDQPPSTAILQDPDIATLLHELGIPHDQLAREIGPHAGLDEFIRGIGRFLDR